MLALRKSPVPLQFFRVAAIGVAAIAASCGSSDDGGDTNGAAGAGGGGGGGASGSPEDGGGGAQPAAGGMAGGSPDAAMLEGGAAGRPDGGPAQTEGGAGDGGNGGGPPTSECGDLRVDDPEECDDGNEISGDGCEPDCTFTCVPGPRGQSMCGDGNPCNGTETCRNDFTCQAGEAPPDGTRCGDAAVCEAGVCVAM